MSSRPSFFCILIEILILSVCSFSNAKSRIVIFGMIPDQGASLSSTPLSAAAQIVLRQNSGSFANIDANDDRNSVVEKQNVRAYFEILRDFRNRGFHLELHLSPTPTDFLDAYRAQDVVGILHENHAVGDERTGVHFLKFGTEALDPAAFKEYKRVRNTSQVQPGHQLQFVYTKACFGGVCRDIYARPLGLKSGVVQADSTDFATQVVEGSLEWIGSNGLVNQHNTKASVASFDYYLQNIFFPNIGSANNRSCKKLLATSLVL